MRDENGIFVGAHVCGHWQGVSHYSERECCGGRKTSVAFCHCDISGIVEAERFCCAKCPNRNEDGRDRNFLIGPAAYNVSVIMPGERK